jgi:hypothetical protein
MSSQIKELDRALAGNEQATSDEIDALVALGRQVNEAYATFTPGHTPQRAMFVRAVTDKDGARWSRFVAPATVTAVLLIALLFLGRSAMPGGTFYPVRQVLRTVGLAPASVEEVQELLAWADRLLDEAEEAADEDPEAAERHAFEAVRIIGMAEGAYDELEADERRGLTDDLARLLARARAILTEAPGEDADRKVDAKNVDREEGGQASDRGAERSSRSNPPRDSSKREDVRRASEKRASDGAADGNGRDGNAADKPSDNETRAPRRNDDEARATHQDQTNGSVDDKKEKVDELDDNGEDKGSLDVLERLGRPDAKRSSDPRD